MRAVISQPLVSRSEEQIVQERVALTELLANKGMAIESSLLACSGRVISLLASLDAMIFMDGWEEDRGCRAEHSFCESHGIPILYAKDL